MKANIDTLKYGDELSRRCELTSKKHFKKNEIITTYLLKRNQICILLNGEAYIIKYLLTGERRILSTLYKGDAFGEALYKLNSSREIFVVAKKDCDVLFLPYDKIETCPKDCFFHLQLLRMLPEIFMQSIGKTNQRIETMTYKGIREKLLAYFKSLAKKNKIILPYSLTDLADYLVLDRSAMMRELSKMQNEGLIKKDGRTIILIEKE